APKAIINWRCEPIIAVGAIIAEIPCVDRIDVGRISTGDRVKVDGSRIVIQKKMTEV
ncbi:MAG TPA: DUF126 domain-containing protein, partial [Nitrososphaeria archaeon]|nr:DUF126 domain-containing protein [Nitrososphaeria archaeon]